MKRLIVAFCLTLVILGNLGVAWWTKSLAQGIVIPDVFQFTNLSATTAAFQAKAGIYEADYHATWAAGNIQLQKLAADSATWVNVVTSWTADGYTAPIYMGAGSYRLAVTTSTGGFVNISQVYPGP